MDTTERMKNAPHIRVEGSGMPRDTRVFYDGKEITNYVRSIHIDMGIDDIPVVAIELIANIDGLDVEVPGVK